MPYKNPEDKKKHREAYSKQYYQRNKERLQERGKKYYEEHKEQQLQRSKEYYHRIYNASKTATLSLSDCEFERT